MKKIVIFAALLLSALLQAQEPTTTWPYLFRDFRQGTIYMKGGEKHIQTVNVHLRAGKLHFLDNDIIKEAVLSDVLLVDLDGARYFNAGGEMMLVVAESPKGMVLQSELGDFASLTETGGAYGTSSATSATRKLSSIDTDSQINQNHMLLKQSLHDGQSLETITKLYIVTPSFTIAADKAGVESVLDASRMAEWKKWLKENKIKWKNPASVITVLDFICQ